MSLFGERAGERTRKLVQAVRAAEGRLASSFVAKVGAVNIRAPDDVGHRAARKTSGRGG